MAALPAPRLSPLWPGQLGAHLTVPRRARLSPQHPPRCCPGQALGPQCASWLPGPESCSCMPDTGLLGRLFRVAVPEWPRGAVLGGSEGGLWGDAGHTVICQEQDVCALRPGGNTCDLSRESHQAPISGRRPDPLVPGRPSPRPLFGGLPALSPSVISTHLPFPDMRLWGPKLLIPGPVGTPRTMASPFQGVRPRPGSGHSCGRAEQSLPPAQPGAGEAPQPWPLLPV